MFKTVTCQQCGKEFVQKTLWHKLCSECGKARARERSRQRCLINYERYSESRRQRGIDKIKRELWFDREWAAWKRDFIAEREQSTAKAPT